jgi:hypothetical protein
MTNKFGDSFWAAYVAETNVLGGDGGAAYAATKLTQGNLTAIDQPVGDRFGLPIAQLQRTSKQIIGQGTMPRTTKNTVWQPISKTNDLYLCTKTWMTKCLGATDYATAPTIAIHGEGTTYRKESFGVVTSSWKLNLRGAEPPTQSVTWDAFYTKSDSGAGTTVDDLTAVAWNSTNLSASDMTVTIGGADLGVTELTLSCDLGLTQSPHVISGTAYAKYLKTATKKISLELSAWEESAAADTELYGTTITDHDIVITCGSLTTITLNNMNVLKAFEEDYQSGDIQEKLRFEPGPNFSVTTT